MRRSSQVMPKGDLTREAFSTPTNRLRQPAMPRVVQPAQQLGVWVQDHSLLHQWPDNDPGSSSEQWRKNKRVHVAKLAFYPWFKQAWKGAFTLSILPIGR